MSAISYRQALLIPCFLLAASCSKGEAPASRGAPSAVASAPTSPLASALPLPSASASASAAMPAQAAPSPAPKSADDETAPEGCDPEKPAPKPNPDNRLYATWQKFRVALGKDLGMGELRVLQDSRLTRPGAARIGTHPLLPPCDLLESRIELWSAEGKTLQVEKGWPELDVELHNMGNGGLIVESIDRVQCLASCWCGNHHAFWRVDNGKLVRHKSKVVETYPRGTKPELGAIIEARGVTHGCYEGSEFLRDSKNTPILLVHRTAMGIWSTSDERHSYENGEWVVRIIEMEPPKPAE